MAAQEIITLFLISVHTPSGVQIDINPTEIVALREPRETDKLVSDKVNCVITTTDGKFTAAVETCEQVRDMLK